MFRKNFIIKINSARCPYHIDNRCEFVKQMFTSSCERKNCPIYLKEEDEND